MSTAEILANEGDRVIPQRQPDMAVVLDDLASGLHRPQRYAWLGWTGLHRHTLMTMITAITLSLNASSRSVSVTRMASSCLPQLSGLLLSRMLGIGVRPRGDGEAGPVVSLSGFFGDGLSGATSNGPAVMAL